MLEILMVGGKVCPTCRRMAPIFEKLKEEYSNDSDVTFRKEDVNDVIPYLQENDIDVSILPSYIFIKDGNPVGVNSGALSFEQFCEVIDGFVQ